MCGIVGYVGAKRKISEILIDGLKRLEYRGYDSAGVAILSNHDIMVLKTPGKVKILEQKIKEKWTG
ncbi:MAG TPA: hypothetical protein PLJ44_07095, partial [Victivallales bacterium]|nr:hypothetical protein [Victivallales bacterium]